MKNIFILFSCCLFSFNLSSQNRELMVVKKYAEYYEPSRENIYVHLNKSIYLTGEDLWFKAYVYDRKNNVPSKQTRNLYCAIYDSIGKQISKKLFLTQDGYAHGNFSIDTSYSNGTYYVKSYTNRMKNFEDNDAFIQKIKVIDKITSTKLSKVDAAYDFQLLPEGGHLISDIENTIGFKLINADGKGVAFKNGKVLDQHDKELTTFSSNHLGVGKLNLNPIAGSNYRAVIVLKDSSKATVEFPKADERGLAISLDNSLDDTVKVLLKTNILTLPDIIDETYRLVIHRDGLFKNITIDPFTKGEYQKIITINKKDLFKGINILTLFDDKGQPILERILFNYTKIVKTKSVVSFVKKTGDSLMLKITAPLFTATKASLSISTLPMETSSYTYRNNILSELYLKPYITGSIENPDYYFRNASKETRQHLDLLLLTQGWSKYDWSRTFKRKKKQDYKYDNGMSVIGQVFKKPTETTLLFGPGNTLNKAISVDKRGSFEINNLFLEQGGSVRFSLANKAKGSLTPPVINLQYTQIFEEDKLAVGALALDYNIDGVLTSKSNYTAPLSIIDGAEELDEVMIRGKNMNEKEELERPHYASVTTERHIITEDIRNTFGTVPQFIRSLGLDVYETDPSGAGYNLSIRSKLTTSFIAPPRGDGLGKEDPKQPTIYMDGVRLPTLSLEILFKLSLDEIEEIYYDKHGFGYGLGGTAGVITINTKKNNIQLEEEPTFTKKIVTTGFTKAKVFYTPKYTDYMNSGFIKYGVIDWKPTIKIDKNKETYFKIFNTKIKELTFYIEGMDEKGNLYSDVQTISF